ncbi:bone morphogenetic protein 8B-like [Octopus sinensis]|uniref:Bone morphogenetic protein 8B-like n=1 Tax=Octopus sinensis TaxID=2607531 RepID=A0A7E6EHM2_9MOLL|nr:bone morphogenetic protein 8B-like [Octopus sinensis]
MYMTKKNLVINVTAIVKQATAERSEQLTFKVIHRRSAQHQSCRLNTNALLIMYSDMFTADIKRSQQNSRKSKRLFKTSAETPNTSAEGPGKGLSTQDSPTETTPNVPTVKAPSLEEDKRRRRSLQNTSSSPDQLFNRNFKKHNTTNCSLKPWQIRFSDIRLNWILSPKVYNASYCSGHCLSLIDSRVSNHAFLRNKYHLSTGYSHVHIPYSYCVPSVYSPLPIIYESKLKEVLIGTLHNVIALDCACW